MLLHQSIVTLPLGLSIIKGYFKERNITLPLDDLNAEIRSPHAPIEHKKLLKELSTFEYRECAAQKYQGIATPENLLLAQKIVALTDIEGFDLIGIRINSFKQALPAFLLAEIIKKVHNTTIVIGGPYVTLFAEKFFKQYSFIDYAIIGPGEFPLLKLLDYSQGKCTIENVPSLYYRKNGETYTTPKCPSKIEDQVLPDYDDLIIPNYTRSNLKSTPYLFSWGCVNACDFCVFKNVDDTWQVKSIPKVIHDLKTLKSKYGLTRIWFDDSNFNVSYEHVEKLCDSMIAENLNIEWGARVQNKGLDERLLQKMKKAGCVRLQWGLESASDSLTSKMNKQTDISEATKIYSISSKLGIKNTMYVMFRYPYETLQELSDTVAYVKKHSSFIDEMFLYDFILIYGSGIYNKAAQHQITIQNLPGSFYSYIYAFSENNRQNKIKHTEQVDKLTRKLFNYNFKYILSKRSRFPINIAMRVLGYTSQLILLHIVLFVYHSKTLNSFKFVRHNLYDIGRFMQRFTPILLHKHSWPYRTKRWENVTKN